MSGLPPSSAHGASRVRPFLFKTRLCPAFMATAGSATPTFHGNASPLPTQHQHQENSSSGCRFGAACSFAHGPDELRTTKQNIAERVTSENGLHAYRRRARAAARGGVRNAPIPAPPEDVAGSLPNSPREDVPCLARAGDGPSSSAEKSRMALTSSLQEPLSRVSIEEKPLPTVKETSVAADVADARQPHPVSPLVVNEPAVSTCSAASSASLGSPAPPQHPRRSSALLAVQTAPSIGAHGDRYPFQHDPYRPIKRSPPAAGSGHVTPVMASRAEHVGSSSTPT